MECTYTNLDSIAYYTPRLYGIAQRFSTAGPRPGTRPWHQLYWAVRGSPGIDN